MIHMPIPTRKQILFFLFDICLTSIFNISPIIIYHIVYFKNCKLPLLLFQAMYLFFQLTKIFYNFFVFRHVPIYHISHSLVTSFRTLCIRSPGTSIIDPNVAVSNVHSLHNRISVYVISFSNNSFLLNALSFTHEFPILYTSYKCRAYLTGKTFSSGKFAILCNIVSFSQKVLSTSIVSADVFFCSNNEGYFSATNGVITVSCDGSHSANGTNL